jgi:hypothetical protein
MPRASSLTPVPKQTVERRDRRQQERRQIPADVPGRLLSLPGTIPSSTVATRAKATQAERPCESGGGNTKENATPFQNSNSSKTNPPFIIYADATPSASVLQLSTISQVEVEDERQDLERLQQRQYTPLLETDFLPTDFTNLRSDLLEKMPKLFMAQLQAAIATIAALNEEVTKLQQKNEAERERNRMSKEESHHALANITAAAGEKDRQIAALQELMKGHCHQRSMDVEQQRMIDANKKCQQQANDTLLSEKMQLNDALNESLIQLDQVKNEKQELENKLAKALSMVGKANTVLESKDSETASIIEGRVVRLANEHKRREDAEEILPCEPLELESSSAIDCHSEQPRDPLRYDRGCDGTTAADSSSFSSWEECLPSSVAIDAATTIPTSAVAVAAAEAVDVTAGGIVVDASQSPPSVPRQQPQQQFMHDVQQQQQHHHPQDARFGCSICTDAVVEEHVVTQCEHLYCGPYLCRWLEPGMTLAERASLSGGGVAAADDAATDAAMSTTYAANKRVCPVGRAGCSVKKRVLPVDVRTGAVTDRTSTAAIGITSITALTTTTSTQQQASSLKREEMFQISSTNDDDDLLSLPEDGSTNSDDQQHHPSASSIGLRHRLRLRSTDTEISKHFYHNEANHHHSDESGGVVIPRQPAAAHSPASQAAESHNYAHTALSAAATASSTSPPRHANNSLHAPLLLSAQFRFAVARNVPPRCPTRHTERAWWK